VRPPRTAARGFTLIELIVVVLVIGIIATIAVVAFNDASDRAHEASAKANLSQIATAVVSHHTLVEAPLLTRDMFLEALEDTDVTVVDGLALSAATWTVHGVDDTPTVEGDFAVGFDMGPGTIADDVAGTRAAVVTTAGDNLYARLIVYPAGSGGMAGTVPAGTTPRQILADPGIIGTDPSGDPGDPGEQVPAGPQLLYAPDGHDGDMFGEDVDVDGDTMVISGPYAETAAGDDQGAVWVFRRDGAGTWVHTATLTAPNAHAYSHYGAAVAIDAGTIAVGSTEAPFEYNEEYGYWNYTGAVYIYTGSGATWTLRTTIAANPDGSVWDDFGEAVDLQDGTLVVGAPRDNGAVSQSGKAYVYTGSGATWTLQAQLAAPDGARGDLFGKVVALDGDTVAVAAPEKASRTGAVYVFDRTGTTWSAATKLGFSGAGADAQIGSSLALDGDTLAVGAVNYSSSAPSTVYVMHRSGSTWVEQAALQGLPGDQLGAAVALDGGRLWVGAPKSYNTGDLAYGAVLTYERDGSTWAQTGRLVHDDETVWSGTFGTELAVTGTQVVVGDHGFDSPANGETFQGVVHVLPR
jgi:prepilin-type N-terminal cleavage/methylation domain-containing protein